MKLFIPTCTLNFNNIFSTESISPKAHYATRGFGNRRYYSVEANSLDMAVTLYSKYPVFQVDDADLENYPMVIEIDTDDYEPNNFKLSGSNTWNRNLYLRKHDLSKSIPLLHLFR